MVLGRFACWEFWFADLMLVVVLVGFVLILGVWAFACLVTVSVGLV